VLASRIAGRGVQFKLSVSKSKEIVSYFFVKLVISVRASGQAVRVNAVS